MAAIVKTVNASGPTTLTSLTDVAVITITPGAGLWFVFFNGNIVYPTGQTMTCSIYVNNVQVVNTTQALSGSTSAVFDCQSPLTTVAAGQTIEGRISISNATGTHTLLVRQLTVLKLG